MRRFLPLCLALLLSPFLRAEEAPTLLRRIEEGFVSVFEKVAPTVVVIEADKPSDGSDRDTPLDFFLREDDDRPFHMPEPPSHSEGSGFVIRADGFILTNRHVIEGATSVKVKLQDGRQFAARVAGMDDKTDIAVLKIDARDLPAAQLADSDAVRVGQLVCAIGVPYNLDYSFTCGWVSAKSRSNLTNTNYEDYIQTDAFINPGNSGGPLFDVDGRVVGMNTLINGIGRGLAFAIPSNMLRDVSDALILHGKIVRPWIGIRMKALRDTPALAEQVKGVEDGVVVETIEPNAPAYNSDLRPADIITQIDGVRLRVARDLQREVLKKKVGQKVQLTVWRGGREMTVPVSTGRLPDEPGRTAALPASYDGPGAAPSDLGLQLQDVTPVLARSLGLKVGSGALVTSVGETSPAADANLQRDDVITEVDRKAVQDAAQCRAIFSRRDLKKGVLLFIDRKGQKTYAVLKTGK